MHTHMNLYTAYVCTCTHTHTQIHAHTHTDTHTHRHTHRCTHTHTTDRSTHTQRQTHTHTHTHRCTHTHRRTHTYRQMHTHRQMHTPTHPSTHPSTYKCMHAYTIKESGAYIFKILAGNNLLGHHEMFTAFDTAKPCKKTYMYLLWHWHHVCFPFQSNFFFFSKTEMTASIQENK